MGKTARNGAMAMFRSAKRRVTARCDVQEIAQAKRSERALAQRLVCPGCNAYIRETKMNEHMKSCCPDLMPNGKWPGSHVACAVAARENALVRAAVMQLRADDERYDAAQTSNKEKNRAAAKSSHAPCEDVAAALNVRTERVRSLLRMVSKATPLRADNSDKLEVLYEDDHVLAVNKPPFMRHHPNHRFNGGSLLNQCIGHLGFEPHVVHRLDMDTSGVAVFAKTAACARAFGERFQRKQAHKTYLALAFGAPPDGASSFSVDVPIGFHPEILARRMPRLDGKAAVTDFRVFSTLPASGYNGGASAGAQSTPFSRKISYVCL